jgi:ABC-2 type transport system permease protein
VTGLRRYGRLLAIFWRSSIGVELEYRVNFVANAALSMFWLAWAAVGVSVYFRFADEVAGWTYGELLVVVGLFFTVNGLRQALITPNLARMTEYIRQGTLDFLLTKPIDAQFMVSLRHVGTYNLVDPFLGVVLAAVGVAVSGEGVSAAAIGAFVVLLVAGLLLLYALALVLMSATVWTVSSEGMDDVLQGLVEIGRLPVQMYRGVVQVLLTVVAPVAFLTTFPAEALLGRGDGRLLLVAPAAAAVAFVASSAFWRVALRSYTGASS